jgi:hypothetical protein
MDELFHSLSQGLGLASIFSVLMSLTQIKTIILYFYYGILIEYTLADAGGVTPLFPSQQWVETSMSER